MKTVFKGIILLIVTYFVVNFFTYFVTKPHYQELENYKILTENPQIEVLENKVSYTEGYVKGRTTNTTGEIIDSANVKVSIYNKKGEYLGTKYYNIPYFAPNETVEFEFNYEYKNVGNIEIEVVVEKSLDEEKKENDIGIQEEEESLR